MKTRIAAVTALAALALVAGYGAMSHANRAAGLASIEIPGAAGLELPILTKSSAEDLAPLGPYEGELTESGGFTGDVAEGSEDAKVTVIEYASLTCPHCATFHKTAYKQLKENYIDTGKIRFIYRDYPLNDPAVAASMIARCGGESKYLAFIDLFMTQQHRWAGSSNMMGEMLSMARLGGLGKEQVEACLGDQALGQSVLDRMRAGAARFGVESTPSIVVNGELVRGAGSYDALSAKIDSLLED